MLLPCRTLQHRSFNPQKPQRMMQLTMARAAETRLVLDQALTPPSQSGKRTEMAVASREQRALADVELAGASHACE